MKVKFWPIFLLFVFVFHSTSNIWILVSFYANQEYISQNLCVNRFEVIPVCKGQCYLENQLAEQQNKEKQNPIQKIGFTVFYLPADLPAWEPQLISLYLLKFPLNSIERKGSDFQLNVFHPPRLS